MLFFFLSLFVFEASAFVHAPSLSQTRTVMSAVETPSLFKEISATNLDMTDSMRDYVVEKVGGAVERFQPMVTSCEAHLTVNRNPRVDMSDTFEVVVYAGDQVVRAKDSASSMYGAIDLVAHKLARKLRKIKERKQQAKHNQGMPTIRGDTAIIDLIEDEDEEDAVLPPSPL